MSSDEILQDLKKQLARTDPGSQEEQELRKRIEARESHNTLLEKIGPPALDKECSETRHTTVLAREYYHEKNSSVRIANEILPQISRVQECDKAAETFTTLYHAVKQLWKEKEEEKDPWWPNIVLVGEGGMGKTTSLLALWEELLSEEESSYPVPIFLRLADYGPEESTLENFIWKRIEDHYFKDDALRIPPLKKQFREALPQKTTDRPLFLLLLDGFNEIAAEHDTTGQALQKLSEKFENVQIVISSRYDMTDICNRSHRFTKFSLMLLEDDQIDAFLPKEQRELDRVFETLLAETSLLRYPMMLAIYKETEKEMALDRGPHNYDFMYAPRNKMELLHDFVEALRARMDRQQQSPPEEHEIYMKHLLPRIGYEMDTYNIISQEKLIGVLKNEIPLYTDLKYLKHYPDIQKKISHMNICFGKHDEASILDYIQKIENSYSLLKSAGKGKYYRFFHEDLRCFFAAAYMIKRIKLDCETFQELKAKCIFKELKEEAIAPALRQAIGELIRGTRSYLDREFDEYEGYHADLDDALNVFRETFCSDIKTQDHRIFNFLEILKATEDNVINTDLSGLDLRHIVLNNVKMDETTALADSRINIRNLIPQWHIRWVNYVCYSTDGEKIASGGEDGTIREWSCTTGECLNIYDGPGGRVTSLDYSSPHGEKIVSGGMDNIIREWRVGREQKALKEYEGHSGSITSVKYSPDGKRILSASDDSTIREWDVESGKCLQLYTGHSAEVTSLAYNRKGPEFVSGSKDGTIRLWKVGEEQSSVVIRSFTLTDFSFEALQDQRLPESTLENLQYLRNEQFTSESTFLAVIESLIGTKERELYKELILKYTISDEIISVDYSRDGENIISGGQDSEIKEWDVKTRECIRTYEGHDYRVSCLCFSEDGKKIVSGSCLDSGTNAFFDPLVREWYADDQQDQNENASERTKLYEGHSHGITSVNYSRDGKKIVSASYDTTIKEWDTFSGKCIKTYQVQESITSVRYRSDGKRALVGTKEGNIKEWDLEQKRCLNVYQGQTDSRAFLAYINDDMNILSVGSSGAIEKWDCNTAQCTPTQHTRKEEAVIAHNVGDGAYLSRRGEHSLDLHDAHKSEACITYKLKPMYIISSGKKDSLQAQFPGLLSKKRKAIEEKFINVPFLEDTFVKDIGRDIWNDFLSAGIIGNTSTPKLTAAIFSHDYQKILAIYDRMFVEWDVSKKEEAHVLRKRADYSVSAVCYNREGSKILFACDGKENKSIEELNLASGKVQNICGMDPQNRHTTTITSIHYNHDETHIISGSNDRQHPIRIWETQSGKCIETLPNVFGLLVQGVDMSDVRWEPDPLADDDKKLLTFYGAHV